MKQYKPGEDWKGTFTVHDTTDAAVNADSLPTAALYKNGAIDAGVSVTVANLSTGLYSFALTIPGGYSAGDKLDLVVTATVSSVSTKARVDDIRLVAWPVTALPNATAGATGGVPLSVDSSGRVQAYDHTGAAIAPAATALTNATWTDARAGKIDNLDIALTKVFYAALNKS